MSRCSECGRKDCCGSWMDEDAHKLEQENAELKKINGNMNHGMAKDILKIAKLEQENERLRDFKEFVNMMIRRSLNHTCSDYEALMAIDEKLTKETGNEN